MSEPAVTTDNKSVKKPLIEFGWIVADAISAEERLALQAARQGITEWLVRQFPQFVWRLPLIDKPSMPSGEQAEPVELLFAGVHERDIRHWDFVLIITDADLVSYYKPYALGVPSHGLAAAVLSLSRLDISGGEDRVQRLTAAVLHLFGDINNIPHSDQETALMSAPRSIEALDAMTEISESEREAWQQQLTTVADIRLEETEEAGRYSRLRFYWHAARIGRRDIVSGIWQAQPWLFPVRLSRLTTAALSLLLIFLMTAEVWDLGLGQPTYRVVLLSIGTLLGTSAFVLFRQHMLVRPGAGRMSEQTAVTNITAAGTVLAGMVSTYIMTFTLILLLSWLFFSAELIASWAASHNESITFGHKLRFAGFVAGIGIGVGALGASFEGHNYFRHVTYVDEEL